ncbi:uncharacterized protein LOC133797721 [Humulus lupulus]|uniref:uncharacterized protein LOC133797721 n=1 Tax=Humulus lupulus TaxID=3486 RepID=UPI002B415371|nr:uncharacterized protein LOC133797721 [Humulus lupulus]
MVLFTISVFALGGIVSAKPLDDWMGKGLTGEQKGFSSLCASSVYIGWAMASVVALVVTGELPIVLWFATYRFSLSSAVCVGIFTDIRKSLGWWSDPCKCSSCRQRCDALYPTWRAWKVCSYNCSRPLSYFREKKIAFQVLVKAVINLDPGEEMESLRKQFQEFIAGLMSLPINIPRTRLHRSSQAKKKMVKQV